MSSIRQRILDDVFTTLGLINGLVPYEVSVNAVLPHDLGPADVPGTKVALGVFPGSHVREITAKLGGIPEVLNRLQVHVRGSVQAAVVDVRATTDKLLADVERALWQDRRRGQTGANDQAVDTVMIEFATAGPAPSGSGAVMTFLATVTVTYVSKLGQP